MIIKEIGKVYSKDEPTVSLELNLEDLYWLQGFISYKNGFYKDLQDGIDAETHLRSNNDQQFDIDKVVRFLGIAKPYIINPSASGEVSK